MRIRSQLLGEFDLRNLRLRHLNPKRILRHLDGTGRHATTWQDIPGFFLWRSGQEEAAEHFDAGATFVEVGNYLGRSLASLADVMASSGKQFRLIGVDYCRGSGVEPDDDFNHHGRTVSRGGGTFAGLLHRNLLNVGAADAVTLIVTDSVTAAGLFDDASLDWVHLDARHDYASVKEDINAWLPKVRPGGWLTGDDYNDAWPGLVAAVAETLPAATTWSDGQWRYVLAD